LPDETVIDGKLVALASDGSWTKHRIFLGQEFVIGGYVPSNLGVDSL
jgi:hypothetical protein